MNSIFKCGTHFFAIVALVVGLLTSGAAASDMRNNGVENSTPVMGGYDPVSYFTAEEPQRGSGYHTAIHEGGTYLFASKANKKTFEANSEKYAPQFGGYCAYGVAVGKKFYSDPTIWKVVDGKLYLNLDKKIQMKWNADMKGNIKKAHSNWKGIEHKHPTEL